MIYVLETVGSSNLSHCLMSGFHPQGMFTEESE